MNRPKLTPAQFDALAKLMRLQMDKPSAQAVRMILVDGMDRKTAAKISGATPHAITICLGRCISGMEKALVVTGKLEKDSYPCEKVAGYLARNISESAPNKLRPYIFME